MEERKTKKPKIANIATIRAEEERSSPQQPRHEQVVDRISQLPDCILHSMLSLLTLKESATTTVLSKRWKHLYSSLPHLTLDDYAFLESHDQWCYKKNDCHPFLESHDLWRYKKDDHRWFGNVRNVLGSRYEPVKSCTIVVDYFEAYRDHLYDIIHLLSNSGIKNLTTENCTFYDSGMRYIIVLFPSSNFSCQGLTHLELYRFYLKVPNTFNGLGCLHDLKLKKCAGGDVDFKQLFSNCRAIENLVVEHCYIVRDLVVNAHKLRTMEITICRPLGIVITNAPCLESVTLRYHYIERNWYSLREYDSGRIDYWDDTTGKIDFQKFVRLFESLGGIKNLSLDFDREYIKRLTKEGLVLPEVLPLEFRFNKLKKLTLRMQFDKGCAFSMVSCLLNSCPILEELAIGHHISDEFGCEKVDGGNYWDNQIPLNSMSNQLTTFTLNAESKYSVYWIKFMKFLLTNARGLRRVAINFKPRWGDQAVFEEFQEELSLLQMLASPNTVFELKLCRKGMPEI